MRSWRHRGSAVQGWLIFAPPLGLSMYFFLNLCSHSFCVRDLVWFTMSVLLRTALECVSFLEHLRNVSVATFLRPVSLRLPAGFSCSQSSFVFPIILSISLSQPFYFSPSVSPSVFGPLSTLSAFVLSLSLHPFSVYFSWLNILEDERFHFGHTYKIEIFEYSSLKVSTSFMNLCFVNLFCT